MRLTENFSDKEVNICQLEADEPQKMLRIFKEPAGINTVHSSYMRNNCQTWNARMMGSHLTNIQTCISYSSRL